MHEQPVSTVTGADNENELGFHGLVRSRMLLIQLAKSKLAEQGNKEILKRDFH